MRNLGHLDVVKLAVSNSCFCFCKDPGTALRQEPNLITHRARDHRDLRCILHTAVLFDS